VTAIGTYPDKRVGVSANEKTTHSGKRPRAKTAGSIRLDDLIARKDVKGGRGSVMFGERSDLAPEPDTLPALRSPRKRALE
jgi:hypothetical protein